MLFNTAHNTSNRQRVKVLITTLMLLIGLSTAMRGLAQNTTTASAGTPYNGWPRRCRTPLKA